MAKAFVLIIEQAYKNPALTLTFDITVCYAGADVPVTTDIQHLSVTIDMNATLASIVTSVAARVRADATARGYTVSAGNVFLPSLTSS